MNCHTPGSSVCWSLLRFTSIESVMLLAISSSVAPFSFCLQSFPASGSFPMSQLFTSMAKVLKLQLQHQSFQWISRVDFFRTDWFDLLAVQWTLKNLLQHHNSKASVLWHSAFFMAQLSHAYMTTGKIIVLTIWTFVGQGMTLFFNMLSRFIITILPRNKRLLISRLQSESTMILEPKKIKSVTASAFFPVCHEMMGLDAMILGFKNVEFKFSFFTLLFHPHQEAP